jgi:hypothetical protein
MKFLQRARVQTLVTTALISGSMQFYCQKMARLTINESETSDERIGDQNDFGAELVKKDDYRYVKQMIDN